MGKAVGAISAVLAFFAFLAALLALTAGSNTRFFPQGEMLQLDLSALGQLNIFQNANQNCRRQFNLGGIGDAIGNAVGGAGDALGCAAGQAGNAVGNLVNSAAQGITNALGLPDFVSLHVMTFCTGDLDGNGNKVVQNCPATSINFSFQPSAIIGGFLPGGVNLADIQFPDAITAVENTLSLTTRVGIIAYATGIAAAGVTTLVAALAVFKSSGKVALALLGFAGFGFLALLISSSAATVIIVKGTNVINGAGGAIGLRATRGSIFLGLTWGATIALFLVTGLAAVGFIKNRRGGGKDYDD